MGEIVLDAEAIGAPLPLPQPRARFSAVPVAGPGDANSVIDLTSGSSLPPRRRPRFQDLARPESTVDLTQSDATDTSHPLRPPLGKRKNVARRKKRRQALAPIAASAAAAAVVIAPPYSPIDRTVQPVQAVLKKKKKRRRHGYTALDRVQNGASAAAPAATAAAAVNALPSPTHRVVQSVLAVFPDACAMHVRKLVDSLDATVVERDLQVINQLADDPGYPRSHSVDLSAPRPSQRAATPMVAASSAAETPAAASSVASSASSSAAATASRPQDSLTRCLMVFPDADPDAVRQLLSNFSSHAGGEDERVAFACARLSEGQYKKRDSLKRKQEVNVSSTEPMPPGFSDTVRQLLSSHASFRSVPVRTIKKEMAKHSAHFLATATALSAQLEGAKVQLLAKARTAAAGEPHYALEPWANQLDAEREAFAAQDSAKRSARAAEAASKAAHERAEKLGELIECGCCFGDAAIHNMVQCSEGHLFCADCLRRYAQEQLFGLSKTQLTCMDGSGCASLRATSMHA